MTVRSRPAGDEHVEALVVGGVATIMATVVVATVVGVARIKASVVEAHGLHVATPRRDGLDQQPDELTEIPTDSDVRIYRVSLAREAGRAVLYIPDGMELWRWLPELMREADGRGWATGAYTRDWAELARLLGTGEYEYGLVPSMAALPPDRLPRVVAADEIQRPGEIMSQRRPQVRYQV